MRVETESTNDQSSHGMRSCRTHSHRSPKPQCRNPQSPHACPRKHDASALHLPDVGDCFAARLRPDALLEELARAADVARLVLQHTPRLTGHGSAIDQILATQTVV